MATMKEIAERCGVSPATVSKALNGYKDIGEDTARRIQEAARTLGYFPNASARTLKTKRTNNLGVLFIDQMQSGLAHEYFSGILESFKTQAESTGFDVTFISRVVGARRMTYAEHCRYRGCDGVVIACVDFEDPEVLELARGGIPCVTIEYAFKNRPAILSDNARGMYELVHYLHSQGHRDIAFIHGEPTFVTKKRLEGFRRACAELSLNIPASRLIPALYHNTARSEAATRALLAAPPLPTCIIYPDDYSYIGGLNELERHGLKIPADISAAGYDGIYLSQILHPKLTTIHQDVAAIGRMAAVKLIDIIENADAVPETITIPGRLVPGETVRQL